MATSVRNEATPGPGVELSIKWEGDAVPGVQSHRLSIGAFGNALTALLNGLRIQASSIISLAGDNSEYGSKGGRRAKEAGLIDLEISGVRDGSVAVDFSCVVRPKSSQLELVNDLPEQCVGQFLDGLDAERLGRTANFGARQFLQALPAKITRQTYVAKCGTRIIREVTFASSSITERLSPMPGMCFAIGTVAALGFDSEPFVQVRTANAVTGKLSASREQVEHAVALRHEQVQCLYLQGKPQRLLWMRRVNEARPVLDPEQRIEHLHARWGSVMRRLAQ